jgi:hypothetical protein
MKVFINERSIDRQAKDRQEALFILSNLAKVISKSKTIAYEGKSFRTRCFSSREIVEGVTVKSVLEQAVARQSPADEVARKFTLLTLLSRPYTVDRHLGDNDTINDSSGNCLKKSCFDDAAESISGSLVISATNHPTYDSNQIAFSSSLYGDVVSANIHTEEMLDTITWIFEHNPKHGAKPREVAGIKISEMSLTHEQAQSTLSNGIKIKSKVYGHFGDNWYQFHCHHANKYHGFKVSLNNNIPEHRTAFDKMAALEFKKDCGQIFL